MALAKPAKGAELSISAGLDPDSAEWLRALTANGPEREAGVARLYALLLRIATTEVRRRGASQRIAGPELDDLAHQTAADALLAITGKLGQFRGDSRFTTWAYKFVIFEASTKLARHFWRTSGGVDLDPADWERLPDRFAFGPAEQAEQRELLAAVRTAIEQELTPRQRQIFVAIAVTGVPLEVLVAELGSSRGAIYKTVFDSRRKLRAALIARGYLEDTVRRPTKGRSELDRFLQTDPRDIGCEEAMQTLHAYADLVAHNAAAAQLYPGITAHLHACGPCAEDFHALLATVTHGEG